ncbi:MAG: TetR/AcrR family transcriptional regulator [Alphaproteobacteria bacterium]|nr:TetR/AcrR family transcriptional regulator [Alphaproteobacteria bacterium]
MTRKDERKKETRRRMLSAASQGFRAHGFAGIGVDGIARAAGATSGAFYAHFGSKDHAFRAALDIGLDEVIEGVPDFQRTHGAGWVEAFADYYLGRAHRADLACGCAMTTLSPEVVRTTQEVHAVYEAKMATIAERIADGLEGGSRDARRARAWAMLAVLIGGLTVARAVASAQRAEEIASAVREAAVAAAGPTRRAP